MKRNHKNQFRVIQCYDVPGTTHERFSYGEVFALIIFDPVLWFWPSYRVFDTIDILYKFYRKASLNNYFGNICLLSNISTKFHAML